MRILFSALVLLLHVLITSGASSASCNYCILGENTYVCRFSANITSEYDPLVIEGTHMQGYSDKDVTYLSALVFPIVRELSGAIMDQFYNLQELSLVSASITGISANSFRSCSRLLRIELGINSISSLPSRVFQNCKNLSSLSIFSNEIYVISDEAFTGLDSLEELSMSANRIGEIGQNTFKGLKNMKYLFLSENDISYIHPEAFDELEKLIVLGLRDNRLTTIDSRMFLNLRNLGQLIINDNQLKFINASMFQNLPRLYLLDLEGNGLLNVPSDCFSFIPNLMNLDLANNNFTSIDDIAGSFHLLTDLTWLQLSRNRLRRLNSEPFRMLPMLDRFFITECGVNEIEPNFFENFRNLTWFHAQGNECIDQNFDAFGNDSFVQLQRCFDNWVTPS